MLDINGTGPRQQFLYRGLGDLSGEMISDELMWRNGRHGSKYPTQNGY